MPDQGSTTLPAPFGKYLLTQLIAIGGMAEVYRAKIFGASGFEKEMVVKRILPRYAQNPSFVQMLIDEAKIAVSLSHGNIVPIYELGEFEGSYYIAMEFVEGRTVLDILRDAHAKRHPLPWAYCLGIAADVAKGLTYAHTRADPHGNPLNLVHRDINPRNIVVTPAGEVKILDFGIARASNKRHQTASGVIKGTPGYMSPEQMYGHTVDARSDVYCLGILVYELLTLRRLFPVWDVNEMREVFEAGPIPPPSTLARHVAREADGVIMRALSQDIGARFQSAGEFEEAVRTVIARSGVAVTASGLAREVKAIDDAPGPPAPRTSPPVLESSLAPPAPKPHTAPLVHALHTTAPSAGATQPVRTLSMPQPAGGDMDAAHSFVISLAGQQDQVPAELPKMSADLMSRGPRTQVLAQNPAVRWADEIGADAELLALMKATGAHPSSVRRTLLIAAGVGLAGIALLVAFAGADMAKTLQRAIDQTPPVPGVVIVKTIPSGAEVILDGKSRGKTNLKVQGVDTNEPHRLVVQPVGEDAIVIEIEKGDFKDGEDGWPTYIFERDFGS